MKYILVAIVVTIMNHVSPMTAGTSKIDGGDVMRYAPRELILIGRF